MDPYFNGVWSASEVDMVRSFIASYNTNNSHDTNDINKHKEIVDELQGRFPCKESHQVIQLYVDLVVGMNTTGSNNQKVVEEPPHRLNIVPKKKRQHPVAWSHDEHKNFLHGLEVYGRGNWKNISRHFVPTRTPNQICSHAQKYFHRNECTSRKQRFSINDVGLYGTEPWVQKNSSSVKPLAIGQRADKTNYYDIEGQHAVMNKLAHASQASNSHAGTWTRGQPIVASSSIDPTMVQSNSLGRKALAFTRGANNMNCYDVDGKHNGMNNLACADPTSNNQVAAWTKGQQTTTSSSVVPTMVHSTSPIWEVLSFAGSAYNTNYCDFNGQQVALNLGGTMMSTNQVLL